MKSDKVKQALVGIKTGLKVVSATFAVIVLYDYWHGNDVWSTMMMYFVINGAQLALGAFMDMFYYE